MLYLLAVFVIITMLAELYVIYRQRRKLQIEMALYDITWRRNEQLRRELDQAEERIENMRTRLFEANDKVNMYRVEATRRQEWSKA